MNRIVAGAVAGFAATVALSAMMAAKGMMGVMPDLDVIAMLSAMMAGAGPFAMVMGIMAPMMTLVLLVVSGTLAGSAEAARA